MMTLSPLVSVCVPTYNYARFLPDCIESVLRQTLSNWEMVITDDCSTDGTEDIVRKYAQTDSRICYLRNERRLGMHGNLQRAAELGRGKYLKLLCADDWIAPRSLDILCELMELHPRAVLATSASIEASEAGVPGSVVFLLGKPVSVIPGEEMLNAMSRGGGFGGNSNFLIRAAAFRATGGFDLDLLYAGDYDLAARLCRIGDYIHADQPLLYGRRHAASSSSVDPKKFFDVFDWFTIPAKIFQPRRFPNREWRRYQRLTALLTARYMLTSVLEYLRGNRDYARGLAKILRQHGNFLFGLPYLPAHSTWRLYNRLRRASSLLRSLDSRSKSLSKYGSS